MVVLWRVWGVGEQRFTWMGWVKGEGVPHPGVLGRFFRDVFLCSFGGISVVERDGERCFVDDCEQP